MQQTSRGREHLVDCERSETIYLVIRDRFPAPQHEDKITPFLVWFYLYMCAGREQTALLSSEIEAAQYIAGYA